MAVYNPGYPMNYQQIGYPNQTIPYMQSYAAPQIQPQSYATPAPTPVQNDSGITWVQGETAARSYMVANGTSVLLMDSEDPVFYIKTVDTYGRPLPLKIFDYQERTTTSQKLLPGNAELVSEQRFDQRPDIDMSKYITKDEIDKKIDELYKLIDELTATKNNRKERGNNNGQ